MQFGRLYTNATKLPKEDEEIDAPKQEDAARVQLRHNWLQSTITQEFRQSIEVEIGEHLNTAVKMACNTLSNKDAVIQLLIRVDTLKKQLDKYATGK